MKRKILFAFVSFCVLQSYGQTPPVFSSKPALPIEVFDSWPTVNRLSVSNNGQYVSYTVHTGGVIPDSLVIQSVVKGENWKKVLAYTSNAVFTDDNQQLVCLQKGSLCVITLGSTLVQYVANVNVFRLVNVGSSQWLIYYLTNPPSKLVLSDLGLRTKEQIDGVEKYIVSANGQLVFVRHHLSEETQRGQSLHWLDLQIGEEKRIYQCSKIENLVLSGDGTQLAFMVTDSSVINSNNEFTARNSIMIFNRDADTVKEVSDCIHGEIWQHKSFSNIESFTKDGSGLFVRVINKRTQQPAKGAVNLDVWSYTDVELQSQQLNELLSASYLAILDRNGGVRFLSDKLSVPVGTKLDTRELLYVIETNGNEFEAHWNQRVKAKPYLLHTGTGKVEPLDESFSKYARFSPNGAYLIGMDPKFADFYCYDIASHLVINLTQAIPIKKVNILSRDDRDRTYFEDSKGFLFGGWLGNTSLLIYDDYDIWQVDLTGKQQPVTITNGIGRRSQIVFRIAGFYRGSVISKKDGLILSSFSKVNKGSGFYRITDGKANPELLTTGPYVYDQGYFGVSRLQARDTGIYIVKRERSTQSPNYFWTSDFSTFFPISDVYPEKQFNWLTSELVSFRTLDGRTEQAVLYKPENFKLTEKYPLLIHYYERKSQELHVYHRPGEQYGDLDIPWFVSHGYLVLTPDIHYKIGYTGKSAANTIIAAAQFARKIPFVDAKHIGIQGHSFGGYETNYTIAHTHLFAAAVSSCGISDFVSWYGDYIGNGYSAQYFTEVWQFRLGGTLWQKRASYIENSPIFQVDRITTPMLIIANKRDANVPFRQGLEWFTALRRLGKKAWMLQYDNEDHGIFNTGNKKDFVLRMSQFFNHYLKGALAPKWMTRGIPATMKGIDDGLELDSVIQKPGEGLLVPEKMNGLNNK